MNLEIQEIICLLIIIISMIVSIASALKNNAIDNIIESIIAGTSTIITFFIMVFNYEQFNNLSNNILLKILPNSIKYRGILSVLFIIMIFCFIIYLLQFTLNIFHVISPNGKGKKGKVINVVLSVVLGFIRGLILIVLICIPIVLYNNLVGEESRINIFDNMLAYNKVEELVDYRTIEIISDGIKENIASSSITYYNGVTIEDAVSSNSEIENKAKLLTEDSKDDRDKALTLYIWVGNNIKYDNDKAERILNNDKIEDSGAITAFSKRSGICFDFASLYTAMCRSVGLKSRVIIGEAFNGKEYVSHAWNQVYIEDEDTWINVDTTFSVAGNYFDNASFGDNHIEKGIAGEF